MKIFKIIFLVFFLLCGGPLYVGGPVLQHLQHLPKSGTDNIIYGIFGINGIYVIYAIKIVGIPLYSVFECSTAVMYCCNGYF